MGRQDGLAIADFASDDSWFEDGLIARGWLGGNPRCLGDDGLLADPQVAKGS